jgi:hypothetical protein
MGDEEVLFDAGTSLGFKEVFVTCGGCKCDGSDIDDGLDDDEEDICIGTCSR